WPYYCTFMQGAKMYELSADYESIYGSLLQGVGRSSRVKTNRLTAFWPMRGHQFDGDLFVIGRVTNAWYTAWESRGRRIRPTLPTAPTNAQLFRGEPVLPFAVGHQLDERGQQPRGRP